MVQSDSNPTRTKEIQTELPVPVAAGSGSIPSVLTIPPSRRVFWESVAILSKYKVFIITTTLIASVAMGIYLYGYAPNWYRSTASILPARRSSGGLLDNITSSLSSTIKDLGLAKLSSGDAGNYTPLSLMNSRELKEKLITKYGLMKVYNVETMSQALKEFDEHVGGDIAEQGYFTISFEDKDPKRAAAIANDIVTEMNDLNSRLATEEAKHNKVYVEQRYMKLLSDLDSAEQALGAFQKKYGVYSLPDQAKAELTAIGGLEQQKYALEIQLNTAEQLYGTQATETALLRSSLNEINDKLAKTRTGFDANASYFVPTNVLPEVALQYLRLMREVEIQSKLKAFLLPSYEQAKLDEKKETLAFVTLDHAVPTIEKTKPRRTLSLGITLLGTALVSSLIVLVLARWNALRLSYANEKKQLGF